MAHGAAFAGPRPFDADFDNSLGAVVCAVAGSSRSPRSGFRGAIASRRDHLARDIATLGFAADIGRPPVIPLIVAKANGGKGRPHVLFYGHYGCAPVDPLNLWQPSAIRTCCHRSCRRPQIIVARGR